MMGNISTKLIARKDSCCSRTALEGSDRGKGATSQEKLSIRTAASEEQLPKLLGVSDATQKMRATHHSRS
jgi:hypothetical protein